VGKATLASLTEGLDKGFQDHDVGALLKMREDVAGVKVRLPGGAA
jgi:4-hydroxybutyrate dehydrogenase/sulfolactaldehyde 3-reductase